MTLPSEVYSAMIALVISVIGYLISLIGNKKLKKKINSLEEFINSDETEYYVECPTCGRKIILNKVKILTNNQQTEENKK